MPTLMLGKIDMVHDVVLKQIDHAFDFRLDEYFSDLESLTDPTSDDVHAFCAEIERIVRVPQISLIQFERWRTQVNVASKTLNGG